MNGEQSQAKLTHWVLGVGLASVVPLMMGQVGNLWAVPYWRFFPLAWVAFAVYIFLATKIGVAASPIRRYAAVACSVAGVVFGLLANVVWSPSFGHLACVLLLTGWALLVLATVPWTRVIAFTGFLWISWPLPGGLYAKLWSKIHNQAMATGSNILDLFGTTHLLSGSQIELQSRSLDLTSVAGSYDSLFALLFLALLLVVSLHTSLFMGVIVLASVPVVSWLGEVLQFLIQIWAVESLGESWLEGWPSIGVHTGVFLLECGLLWCIFLGVHQLFEPIFTETPDQVNRTIQNAYNQLVIWPVRLTSSAGAETRDYFDDEQVSPSSERANVPIRVMRPSTAAAKLATDPWQWTRGTIGLVVTACLGLLIGVLTFAIPPRQVKPLPEYSDAQLEQIGEFKQFPEASINAQLVGARVGDYNPDIAWREVRWDLYSERGAVNFAVSLPHRQFQPFKANEQWTMYRAPKLINEGDWPVYESEFVDEFGRIAYVWYTAFDKQGKSATAESTWIGNLFSRIENSLIGRVLPQAESKQLFMSTLLLESNQPLSLGGKKTHRAACVAYTKAIAERAIGVQP